MKKLLLLLLTAYSLFLTPALAQYNWQALSNAPQSWRNDDIYFINAQMGWVAHACYGYLTPTQLGQIYRTKDGGNTWQLMHDSSKTFYRAIGFADSLNGWIGNIADTNRVFGKPVTTDTIPLYYTNDGGKTLTPVTLPNPKPKGICGISVATDSVIYAYGRYFGPALLAKTTDKGTTWTTQDMSPYAYGLVDGWFFNTDTGFIAGASPAYKAQILSTYNGGATWNVCYRSTRVDSDEVWKIFFTSRDTGYGAVEYQNLKPVSSLRYFIKTIDGGKTWTELPFIANYDEEGIGFINDSTGWIGGDYVLDTYITYNGGISWQQDKNFGVETPPYQVYGPGYSMNRFRKINDTLMYASGNTVYKLSGKITGVKELHTAPAYVGNYPNPYTDETTITYTLVQNCHNVKIEVFAARGQLMFSKNFGTQSSGTHTYIFNQGMPSGAYYYSITSDEYTVTRKMIRAK